jgi:hypothetical protein
MNKKKFRGIGSLSVCNPRIAANLPERRFTPGTMVAMEMFWGDRLLHDVFRGPLRTSNDWLDARISIKINDYTQRLKEESEDDEKEDMESALNLVKDLRASLLDFSA